MKKLFALCLTAIMALSLVACGGGQTTDTSSTTDTTSTSTSTTTDTSTTQTSVSTGGQGLTIELSGDYATVIYTGDGAALFADLCSQAENMGNLVYTLDLETLEDGTRYVFDVFPEEDGTIYAVYNDLISGAYCDIYAGEFQFSMGSDLISFTFNGVDGNFDGESIVWVNLSIYDFASNEEVYYEFIPQESIYVSGTLNQSDSTSHGDVSTDSQEENDTQASEGLIGEYWRIGSTREGDGDGNQILTITDTHFEMIHESVSYSFPYDFSTFDYNTDDYQYTVTLAVDDQIWDFYIDDAFRLISAYKMEDGTPVIGYQWEPAPEVTAIDDAYLQKIMGSYVDVETPNLMCDMTISSSGIVTYRYEDVTYTSDSILGVTRKDNSFDMLFSGSDGSSETFTVNISPNFDGAYVGFDPYMLIN